MILIEIRRVSLPQISFMIIAKCNLLKLLSVFDRLL